MPIDVRQRAEPIELQLEDPLVVVERFGNPQERHRTNRAEDLHSLSFADGRVSASRGVQRPILRQKRGPGLARHLS